MRPKKQVVKNKDTISSSDVVPITPEPIFTTNTVNVKISRGGFMDDAGVYHKSPKRTTQPFRDAVKISGKWYWAFGVRNRNKDLLVPNSLLFSEKGKNS